MCVSNSFIRIIRLNTVFMMYEPYSVYLYVFTVFLFTSIYSNTVYNNGCGTSTWETLLKWGSSFGDKINICYSLFE